MSLLEKRQAKASGVLEVTYRASTSLALSHGAVTWIFSSHFSHPQDPSLVKGFTRVPGNHLAILHCHVKAILWLTRRISRYISDRDRVLKVISSTWPKERETYEARSRMCFHLLRSNLLKNLTKGKLDHIGVLQYQILVRIFPKLEDWQFTVDRQVVEQMAKTWIGGTKTNVWFFLVRSNGQIKSNFIQRFKMNRQDQQDQTDKQAWTPQTVTSRNM